ncbi:MAG TPA: hypothetical protein H9992_01120, partial [Candidatus Prevotella intestinigallinarum]|nr:hypothetical protein [Candidatus Prevotella intestinigallinarum]
MKQSAYILKAFMAAVMAVVFGTPITAAAQEQARRTDSIEVSLLTCAPGNELYSLYGHTALRYHCLLYT